MLKGAQKKMYVVKMEEDSLFEEAYFVLKRERVDAQGKDMVSEATRIIRQSTGQQSAPAPKKNLPWQTNRHFRIYYAKRTRLYCTFQRRRNSCCCKPYCTRETRECLRD